MFAEQVQQWLAKSPEWCPCSKGTRTNYCVAQKTGRSDFYTSDSVDFPIAWSELPRKHSSSFLQRIKKPSQMAKTLGENQGGSVGNTPSHTHTHEKHHITGYNIKLPCFTRKLNLPTTSELWQYCWRNTETIESEATNSATHLTGNSTS